MIYRHSLVRSLFVVVVFCCTGIVHAADDEGSTSGFWPSFEGWKAPKLTMPEMKEPAFMRASRQKMGQAWQASVRTTKSAWNKTLYALRPYNDPEPKRKPTAARREADAGFWSNLFGGKKEEKPMTVNDFLKQPTPY